MSVESGSSVQAEEVAETSEVELPIPFALFKTVPEDEGGDFGVTGGDVGVRSFFFGDDVGDTACWKRCLFGVTERERV